MSADKYNDSLDKIRATAQTNVITLNALLSIAKNEELSYSARQEAINKLNKDYDIFNKNLTLQNINSKETADSVKRLTSAIYLQAEAQILQNEIQDEIAKRRKLEGTDLKDQAGLYDKFIGKIRQFNTALGTVRETMMFGGFATVGSKMAKGQEEYNKALAKAGLKNFNSDMQKSDEAINKLTKDLESNFTALAKIGELDKPDKKDAEEGRIKKLNAIYKELADAKKKVEYDTFSSELEKANTLVDAHKKALESLIELGVSPLSKEYNNVRDSLLKAMRSVNDEEGKLFAAKLQANTISEQAKLAAEAELKAKEKSIELQKELNALGNDSVAGELTDDPTYEILTKRNDAFDKMNKKIIDFRNLMSDTANILVGPLSSAFETMIQTGNFGIKGLIDMLKQMIVKLIAAVAAAAILALIFAAITGGMSATAGGGGFLKMFQGLMGGKGMFPGLKPRAKGGIFSGPSAALVGEYPGAKNNPEVIAPLDKLKSLISDTGNGGQMIGKLETRISGNDLVILMNRASKNRNGYF
jgi:multidrug efflux pump subunit AcrA (membrane-fusion protein)